jgi:cob(I)alamin adenosyltransferase
MSRQFYSWIAVASGNHQIKTHGRDDTLSDRARILIITGNGKGKTTSALGMAMRASGHGLRVRVIQFIKGTHTGELSTVQAMANIQMVQTGRGFLPKSRSGGMAEHKQAAEHGLAVAAESIVSGQYDTLILDEICVAVSQGLIQEQDVVDVMACADPAMTLVLTGRYASPGLIDLADTVSRIECVKHGYDAGIAAQKGVEF